MKVGGTFHEAKELKDQDCTWRCRRCGEPNSFKHAPSERYLLFRRIDDEVFRRHQSLRQCQLRQRIHTKPKCLELGRSRSQYPERTWTSLARLRSVQRRLVWDAWYGLYSPTGSRNPSRTFSIKVNTKKLSADAPAASYWTWVRSSATHELGHALSLNDNPGTTSASLMKHSRNRATIYLPQTYDKNEVKAIYP